MLRKVLVTGSIAGAALATAAAPVSASTGGHAASARIGAPSSGDGHSTASSTAIAWGISAYKCGQGVIGAQARQAKNGPDVNGFITTHQLQRWNGASYRTVASRSFSKAGPLNGVWYYSPGPSTRLDWTPATAGRYRINVVYKYYKNGALVAKRALNTAKVTGTVCVFR
jgi:hypothetical protein